MTAIRFSYYELSLLSFLRESHPEKADDIPFVKERAAAASEAYAEAFDTGLPIAECIGIANKTLYAGLHFSHHDTISSVLWNEFSALYPENKIRIRGFEEIESKFGGYFDVVSSNIPFGDMAVFDPVFSKTDEAARKVARMSLHNYFFVKGVDMLREGGVLVFITSQGVMNAPTNEPVREWLMNHTRLVSAVRLLMN